MSETGAQIFGGLGLLVRGSNRPEADSAYQTGWIALCGCDVSSLFNKFDLSGQAAGMMTAAQALMRSGRLSDCVDKYDVIRQSRKSVYRTSPSIPLNISCIKITRARHRVVNAPCMQTKAPCLLGVSSTP